MRANNEQSVNELYYTQRINSELNKAIQVLEKKAIIPVLISLLGFVLLLTPQCQDYSEKELDQMSETDRDSAEQESEVEQSLIIYCFVGTIVDTIYQVMLIKRCSFLMAIQNKSQNVAFRTIFQKISRIRNHKQLQYTKVTTVIYYSYSMAKLASFLCFFMLGSAIIQIIQQWTDITCNIFVHIYYGFILVEYLIYIVEQTIHMTNFKTLEKTNYFQMSRRNQIRVQINEQNENQNIQQIVQIGDEENIQQNELNREKLEVMTFAVSQEKQYFTEEQQECTICLENYNQEDELIFLQCDKKIKHHFHFDCLNEWVHMRENQCPICRKNIAEI